MRARARELWSSMHTSPVQLSSLRYQVTSPYRRKPAGPLASAPGQTYSFIYFAHARAHTRTHAHMRAHTDPSPRRASPRGFGAELAAGPLGLTPGLSASEVVHFPTPKWPAPETTSQASHPELVFLALRTLRGRVATSLLGSAPWVPLARCGTRVRGSEHTGSLAEGVPRRWRGPGRGCGS